jgi:hypothetical protein
VGKPRWPAATGGPPAGRQESSRGQGGQAAGIAAAIGFNLAAGQSTVVNARWTKNLVPPAGTHSCLLAAVLTPGDFPTSGAHAWEHNNLAQKNLTIVDLQPDNFIVIPFVVANIYPRVIGEFALQLIPHQAFVPDTVNLVRNDVKRMSTGARDLTRLPPDAPIADCGRRLDGQVKDPGPIRTADSARYAAIFPARVELPFTKKQALKIPIDIWPTEQHVYGLKLTVPANAVKGQILKYDLAQIDRRSGKVLGGIAVELHVV